MKNIYMMMILTSSLVFADADKCQMYLDLFASAKSKASLHIETDSSKYHVLVELTVAKDSLINAITECKPYLPKQGYAKMKPDLKKLSKLIKDVEKW